MEEQFILLYGVNERRFNACFGDESQWPCKFESLAANCSETALNAALHRPGLLCVVVQDIFPAADLVSFYEGGGFVVYFGVIGVFADPKELSNIFDLEWNYSAYTAHQFVLTDVGRNILGNAITDQQYTKANLLSVPVSERILVPKTEYPTIEEFKCDVYDSDDEDVDARAEVEYAQYNDRMGRQAPLALHKAGHGGRIAYLGFIDDDGNIPQFVQSLCTGVETSAN